MNKENEIAMQNLDDYEEVADVNENVEAQDVPQQISLGNGMTLMDAVDRAEQVMDVAQTVAGMYKDCMAIEAQNKQVKTWGDVEITKTIAKFKSTQDFLQKSFGERDKALTKHYDILDKAVATNDKEMILAALKGISSIVTKSPLDDFDKFVAMYNDTTQPLFDF